MSRVIKSDVLEQCTIYRVVLLYFDDGTQAVVTVYTDQLEKETPQ